jgi:hypothetical protein
MDVGWLPAITLEVEVKNRLSIASAVAATLLLGSVILTPLTHTSAAAPDAPYHPIPPGFDFPADQQTLLNMRDHQDVAGMRKHAWMVFAGMTQPVDAGGEPVWETWYAPEDVFTAPATGAQLQGLHRTRLRFEVLHQLQRRGARPQALGANLASFTLFNGDTRDWVQKNALYSTSALDTLNNGFTSSGTPVAQREIKEFPNKAMSLKAVWLVVKSPQNSPQMTGVPVWDPPQNVPVPDTASHPMQTWSRFVAVDASGNPVPPATKATANFVVAHPNSPVVSINRFYSIKLTDPAVVQALHGMITIVNARSAAVGDYVVLLGLHYTTKEIPQWVWSTFWWHDRPNDPPFGADRPSAVKGVWQNYRMTTTYGMDTPKEKDGSPPIAFNPYIEAGLTPDRFGSGIQANCMSCHQQAVHPSDLSFTLRRGTIDPADPTFQKKTKTDFAWSIPQNEQ